MTCGVNGLCHIVCGGSFGYGVGFARRRNFRFRFFNRLLFFAFGGGDQLRGFTGLIDNGQHVAVFRFRNADDRGLGRHRDDLFGRRGAQHDYIIAGLQRLGQDDGEIAPARRGRIPKRTASGHHFDKGTGGRGARDDHIAVRFDPDDIETGRDDPSGLCGRIGVDTRPGAPGIAFLHAAVADFPGQFRDIPTGPGIRRFDIGFACTVIVSRFGLRHVAVFIRS